MFPNDHKHHDPNVLKNDDKNVETTFLSPTRASGSFLNPGRLRNIYWHHPLISIQSFAAISGPSPIILIPLFFSSVVFDLSVFVSAFLHLTVGCVFLFANVNIF